MGATSRRAMARWQRAWKIRLNILVKCGVASARAATPSPDTRRHECKWNSESPYLESVNLLPNAITFPRSITLAAPKEPIESRSKSYRAATAWSGAAKSETEPIAHHF